MRTNTTVMKNPFSVPLTFLGRTRAFLLGYDPACLHVDFPLNVQLSLNKTCNLHCTFCARQTSKIQQQLAAEPSLVIPLEFLSNNLSLFERADYVNIAADGEPLHHPEIKKILSLLTAQTHKPNLIFVTNGVLFDDQLIELAVRSQVMEIHFSIDSLKKDFFNFLRPGADLDGIISTIEKINLLKKQYSSEFPRLILRPTFISETIAEFPSMVEFCHKYHFYAMMAQQMQIYKRELARYSLINCKEVAKKYIDAAIKMGHQLGIGVVMDSVIINLENQGAESIINSLSKIDESGPATKYMKDMKVNKLREKCNLPWEYMLVQTNGLVYPCCHSQYCLGNLTNESWEQIWNGPRAREMRKKFTMDILPKECVNQPCGIGKLD